MILKQVYATETLAERLDTARGPKRQDTRKEKLKLAYLWMPDSAKWMLKIKKIVSNM
jgi:hypothetical protein